MNLSRIGATGLLLLTAGSGIVSAQVVGPRDNCTVIVDGGTAGDLFNACVAGDLSRLNTIYIPYVVARAVANSFHIGPAIIGPPVVEPAGLQGLIAADADQRLQPSPFVISPAADVAAAAPAAAVAWNAWANGRYLHSD